MAGDRQGRATVYGALASVADASPDATAIVFEGERIPFAELLRRVDGTALRLRELGIGHRDTFAVYAQNCPEIMLCYYAAARLGAVLVPINPNMTAAEVAHAVSHSGAGTLFHDEVSAEAARAAMPGEGRRPLSDLASGDPGASPSSLDPAVAADDDFLVIYTSGSTGTPKAIVLDQQAQVGAAVALGEMWGVTAEDVTVVALPLGYLYGLSTASAVELQAGGTVVIVRRFRPGDVLDALVAHGATVFHGVPTMFSMMLEYVEQRDLHYDLSGMRLLVCAGAPLADELKQRFARRFGKGIQNYYAATECTPVLGVHASDPRPVPASAIGRLAPMAEIRIVDPDGRECPDGTPGELLVRGAATLRRYHKEPGMTDAALVDGLFRTGDVGYRDADGNYFITGRIKDVIIRGGANIAPAEVEGVLARHPAVQDVVVIGAPDQIFGEVPVAFVVPRLGSEPTADDLVAHAARDLADFKIPKLYAFEKVLPLGRTGKVDKAALKVLWSERNRT